jgi:hypothetical protein
MDFRPPAGVEAMAYWAGLVTVLLVALTTVQKFSRKMQERWVREILEKELLLVAKIPDLVNKTIPELENGMGEISRTLELELKQIALHIQRNTIVTEQQTREIQAVGTDVRRVDEKCNSLAREVSGIRTSSPKPIIGDYTPPR